MLAGLKELRAAGQLLAQSTSQTDLERAAEHAWSAIFYQDDWPEHLRQQAEALTRSMLQYGPIRATISQMSTQERDSLRRDILSLVDAAERTARHS